MKKVVLLPVLLFLYFAAPAQKISNVDFDAIKKSMDDYSGYYPGLLNRFIEADTTLTRNEYMTLYYGQCFREGYNPYGTDPSFEEFKKHYQAEDFAKALPIAMKMIEKNPLDMKMTFKAMVCNHYLKDDENKRKLSQRYNNILMMIYESGDGKTESTAFVVMCISDEYEMMANLEVSNTSQALRQTEQGPCDVMTLKTNDLGLDKLYFNVTKPFESMSKMFKGK